MGSFFTDLKDSLDNYIHTNIDRHLGKRLDARGERERSKAGFAATLSAIPAASFGMHFIHDFSYEKIAAIVTSVNITVETINSSYGVVLGSLYRGDGKKSAVNSHWMVLENYMEKARLPLFVTGAVMLAAGGVQTAKSIIAGENPEVWPYVMLQGYSLLAPAFSSYLRDNNPKHFVKDPFWSRFNVKKKSLETAIENLSVVYS